MKTAYLLKARQYLQALQVCYHGFSDLHNWENNYGGRAWAKIADVLIKIEEKRQFLDLVRKEYYSEQRDSRTDYLDLEIETMKEIVVLMNIFDGLAHNSGKIMPKLIKQEMLGLGEDPYQRDDKKIKQMMDAKELEDPAKVYAVIKDIMQEGENKYLFEDWLDRARDNSEFRYDNKEVQLELKKISDKKEIKQMLGDLVDGALDRSDDIIRNIDYVLKFKDVSRKYMITGPLRTINFCLKDFIKPNTLLLLNLGLKDIYHEIIRLSSDITNNIEEIYYMNTIDIKENYLLKAKKNVLEANQLAKKLDQAISMI